MDLSLSRDIFLNFVNCIFVHAEAYLVVCNAAESFKSCQLSKTHYEWQRYWPVYQWEVGQMKEGEPFQGPERFNAAA